MDDVGISSDYRGVHGDYIRIICKVFVGFRDIDYIQLFRKFIGILHQ